MVAHFGEALVTDELLNKLRLAAKSDNEWRKDADAGLPLERCLLWSFTKLELVGESNQSSQNCECDAHHHQKRETSYNGGGLAQRLLRASALDGHAVASRQCFLM